MPRTVDGNYYLPAGNPVVSGTLITTGWANPTLDDVAAALADSLSRSGAGGMLAPLKHADGTSAAPGITFATAPNVGFFKNTGAAINVGIEGTNPLSFDKNGVWTNIPPLNGNYLANKAYVDSKLAVASLAKKNLLLNGAFTLWQRGTTFDGVGDKYTADRWYYYDGTGDLSTVKKAGTSIDSPAKLSTTAYVTVTSNVDRACSFLQLVEDGAHIAGQRIGLQCSSRQSVGSGVPVILKLVRRLKANSMSYANIEILHSQSFTQSGSWATFSFEFDVPEDTNRSDYYYGVMVEYETPQTGDEFALTAVQLEVGGLSNYEYVPLSEEYNRCQRYYEKGISYAKFRFSGGQSMDQQSNDIGFQTIKRVGPTLTLNYVTGSYFETLRSDSYGFSVYATPSGGVTHLAWNAEAEL